jgi:hypothetical protein
VKSGEGQEGLGLDPSHRQNLEAVVDRSAHGPSQQGGLADPSHTSHQECTAGSLADTINEVAEDTLLGLTAV